MNLLYRKHYDGPATSTALTISNQPTTGFVTNSADFKRPFFKQMFFTFTFLFEKVRFDFAYSGKNKI